MSKIHTPKTELPPMQHSTVTQVPEVICEAAINYIVEPALIKTCTHNLAAHN
jgi:hypothetical protein